MENPVPRSPLARTTLTFTGIALVCAIFADISVTTVHPWRELSNFLLGAFTPDFFTIEDLGSALLYTLAFAFLGVALGNMLGFLLSLVFFSRLVRTGCAMVRAIHELFWALIFLQIFGLSPLTGILAIAIPYAGIIAKVYAEILEEADPAPLQAVPYRSGHVSTFLFVRLPDVWSHFRSYSLYRLECGLRSSAVLGFVGLPTLGYHLESAFKQGQYPQVWALLFIFYLIIATIRVWMKRSLLPVYLIGSILVLPWGTTISIDNIRRFFAQDIIPYPLRASSNIDAGASVALGDWLHLMLFEQAIPGAIATLQLTMIALMATGMLTLVFFPLISPLLFGRVSRTAGHVLLVVVRSTPEYILAFVLLQLWGPSMLPALVALSLHNGAIIGHLIGRFTEGIQLRIDASGGFNLYAWEILPRVYRPLIALLFYRWEVILRETAILGMLGIATLGFYVDSAFAELRYDRAMFLILITAVLNICVDAISRAIRSHLRLQTSLEHQQNG